MDQTGSRSKAVPSPGCADRRGDRRCGGVVAATGVQSKVISLTDQSDNRFE
jgi:hypothetical protein